VGPLRLYTFTISHFSEKIRWTLTHEGVPFVEVPWVPALHVVSARAMGGGATTVPIVESDGERVQDSTAIIEWLDARRPLDLLPHADRAAVMALEAKFDEVGTNVVRLAYDHAFPDGDSVVRLWTIDASRAQTIAIRVGLPIFRVAFSARLGMSPKHIERARASLDAALTLIEDRIASGARYLVGDRLSLADVTAASLLAPIACPDEHPVYGSPKFRERFRPLTKRWEARPAIDWVRSTYRDHRGAWPRASEIRAAVDR
jgi:glutathione S-transferase